MIFISEPRISQLCYNMGLGSTEPKFAILEDGTQVVTKLMNGPEGNLVLFNEYLCYRLAILLDIPMPRSGICVLDEQTEIQAEGLANERIFTKSSLFFILPIIVGSSFVTFGINSE